MTILRTFNSRYSLKDLNKNFQIKSKIIKYNRGFEKDQLYNFSSYF